uniref:Capsid protein n=1 Tax=Grus japonensis parvo-like hybrid virus TaxID=2794511 RepID=A0A8A4XDT6_9VIRU|nr:MAG: capsid protein [Grus japonensis parvo-like hybrid virus]QTE03859.1 MAG: capsid protein [Grus japonensis parvo-like hybrid virus]
MARGWVPPGYDYLGPGNDLHRGPPRNENDVLAQDHDQSYTALLEAGGRPYTQWSEADRRFYENLTVDDIPTAVAKGLFGLKKGLYATGLIDATDSQSNLRGRANMARNNLRQAGDNARRENDDRRGRQRDQNQERQITLRRNEHNERRHNLVETNLDGMIDNANNDARGSLRNLPGDDDLGPDAGTLLDDMEVPGNDGEGVGNAMMAFAGGDGGSAQSKETPISIPPSITYALQETHTTILPWNGWVSAVGMDTGIQVQLPIRMNGVNDMIPATLGLSPAAGAVYPAKGLYGTKLSSASTRSFWAFPAEMAGGTWTTEKPWWRDYWYNIYEYYTVLKCHYEIIIDNPIANGNALNASVIIGTQFDSYSDTASSVGNVMPITPLVEAMSYKGIRWEKVDSQSPNETSGRDNNRTVISGTWMPGMTKRNIVNDGDVKTWTKTDGTIPNLKEIMTVNFWRHPLAQSNTTGNTVGVNVQMNLKYVVQFKDLKLQARYPTSAITDQDILQRLDDTPNSNSFQSPY